MIELLGIGTPVMDIYCEIEESFFKKNGLKKGCTNHLDDKQVLQIEKEITPIYKYPGDNARNVCEAFAKAGAKVSAYCGNIADDRTGKEIVKNLKQNRIENFMQKIAGKTGRIICMIDKDKQRTFAVYLGVGEKHLNLQTVDAPKILFCTNITLFHSDATKDILDFAIRCKKNGTKIAVSLESENLIKQKVEQISELCKIVDYLFLNEDEMHAIGKNEQSIATIAPVVFLKRGANGASVYEDGKLLAHVVAKKIDKVIDTTGAGDFFAGATLNAILSGRNFVESARAGNEMAGQVISRVGASV